MHEAESNSSPGDEVEALLEPLLASPWPEQAAALQRLCVQHPNLADALRRRHATFRELLGNTTLPPAKAPAAPQKIGPYRILDTLGEGGMGSVYLAEQSSPVKRRVALKLIKLGMDSKAVVARFEQERQALALMQHDGIAKVFDCGTNERGQPFFVMELVKGVPLTEYCDRQRLSLPDRLKLMQQVCAAVTHAHQKGVVHRDLKPGNVLVAEDQGKAQVKIIDFGLAKAMGPKLVEATLFTEAGQVVGTPEYMAPEQADPTNADIDTRADVYSLGVMLYEVLAGQLPFSSAELRQGGLLEMQRVLREIEPKKPSSRLVTVPETAGAIAARRQTSAPVLHRALKNDLDWVVMRAIEKDPGRRYDSAAALAADLGRYLDLEPVLAGPPSVRYRLQKLLHRHRVPAAAAAVVLLTALVGAVGVTWSWVQTSKALLAAVRNGDESILQHAIAVTRTDPTRGLAVLKGLSAQHHLADDAWCAAHQAKEWGVAEWVSDVDDITSIAWSPTCSTLAYGCRSGSVRRFDFQTGKGRMDHDGGGPVGPLAWSPDGHCLAWSQDQEVYISPLDGAPPRRLPSHDRAPSRLQWSADGKWLASSTQAGLEVWEAAVTRLAWETQSEGSSAPRFEWSPQGAVLAVGGLDLSLWSDGHVRRIGRERTLGRVQQPIECLSWDPTSAHVLTGDHGGEICLFEVASGQVKVFPQVMRDDASVRILSWSPDGTRIACLRAIGEDGRFAIGRSRLSFLLPTGRPCGASSEANFSTTISWSPDSQRIVLGRGAEVEAREPPVVPRSGDKPWPWTSPPSTLYGHHSLQDTGWSEDGHRLATLGSEGIVRVWPLGGERRRDLGSTILSKAWMPGESLGVADKTEVRVWDTRSNDTAPVLRTDSEFTAVAWTSTGDRVAVATADRGLQVASGDVVGQRIELPAAGKLLAWSPDGRSLAATASHAVHVWTGAPSTANPPATRELQGSVRSLHWAPNGDLAWVEASGSVHFWNMGLESSAGIEGLCINDCAWSPTGDRILLGCRNGEVILCEVRSGQVAKVHDHSGFVDAVAWSRDGRLVASLGSDFAVKVSAPGSLPATFRLEGAPALVQFSPDGAKLLAGSDTATCIWDLATGARLELGPPHGLFAGAQWSPDSKQLARSVSREVRIWTDDVPRDARGIHAWASTVSNATIGHGKSVLGIVEIQGEVR